MELWRTEPLQFVVIRGRSTGRLWSDWSHSILDIGVSAGTTRESDALVTHAARELLTQ